MTPAGTLPLSSFSSWADAVCEMERSGILPTATVMVPNSRAAHALRRELFQRGANNALRGTSFLSSSALATAVLQHAGVDFQPGEEALRPARIRRLISRGLILRHFEPQLLRETPGWDDALARTLGDLEGSGVPRAELASRSKDARVVDLLCLWSALDMDAGHSWTRSRQLLEATGLLRRSADAWPFDGPTLAAITGHETGAEAAFIQVIPRSQLGVLASRPLRTRYLERLAHLFGEAAASAARVPRMYDAPRTELDLLTRFLLEDPAVLSARDRPRSHGPDGTVSVEEHSGVDRELDAAVDWVQRQVLEHGTPLERIACFVPRDGPLTAMLVDRLSRLPFPGGELPVHVAGGLPVLSFPTGTRLRLLLTALRQHLGVVAVAELMPSLRSDAPQERPLSRARSDRVLYALGTLGGSPSNRAGSQEWPARLTHIERRLEEKLGELRQAPEAPGESARRISSVERELASLRAIKGSVVDLAQVASISLAGGSLADLWPVLKTFIARRLYTSPAQLTAQAAIIAGVDDLAADPLGATLTGVEAFGAIEELLRVSRVSGSRFGAPAVYIGTVDGAVGLPFEAVRVLGLAEGTLPSSPREDPVLPESLKDTLLGPAAFTHPDHSLAQVHSLARVIGDTSRTVALSAPRTDLSGTMKEPSSLFIEAAAALGRPHSQGGYAALVPNGQALLRDYVRPAREDANAFRRAHPVLEDAWQDRTAEHRDGIPFHWSARPELDVNRILAVLGGTEGSLDGHLGMSAPGPLMRGLTPAQGISASALGTLLKCPHLFLFTHVLGWRERETPAPTRELDPLSYGTLAHEVLERFSNRHGEPFGRRAGILPEWKQLLDGVAAESFSQFVDTYPLVGAAVRAQQLKRLQRDVRRVLEYDWNEGVPRTFVAAERFFGYPEPISLRSGQHELFVHGYIDRIDVDGGWTLVRDYKTGRAKPRRQGEGPDPRIDLQLGVYGRVAQRLAKEWKTPANVAVAYVYPVAGREERAYREDFGHLEQASIEWLSYAAATLKEHHFPRTPDEDDCRFCFLNPVCGAKAAKKSAEQLGTSEGVLLQFLRLRGGTP